MEELLFSAIVPTADDTPKEKKRKRKELDEEIKQVEKASFEIQKDFIDKYDSNIGILLGRPEFKRARTKDFKNLFKLPKDASDEMIKEYVKFANIEFLVRDLKEFNANVKQIIKESRYDDLYEENFQMDWNMFYENNTIKEKDFQKFLDVIFPERKLPKLQTEEKVFIPMTKPLLNSSYFELPPQLRPIVPGSMLYNKNDRMFVVDNKYNNFLVQMISPSEGDDWKYDPTKVKRLQSYDFSKRKMEGIRKSKNDEGYFIDIIAKKFKDSKKWKTNPTNVSFAGFEIFDKSTKNISNTKITNPIEELELPEDPETKKFKIPKTQLEAEPEEENPVKGLKIPVQLSEEQIREKKEKQLKAFEKERKRREEELKSEALKRARKMLKGTEVRKDEIKEAIRFKKESERIAKQIQEMKGQKRNMIGGSSKKPTEKEEREKEEKLKEKRKREAKAREESKKRMDEQLDPEFIKRQQELEKKKKEAKEKKKREAKAMFMKMRGKGKGKI